MRPQRISTTKTFQNFVDQPSVFIIDMCTPYYTHLHLLQQCDRCCYHAHHLETTHGRLVDFCITTTTSCCCSYLYGISIVDVGTYLCIVEPWSKKGRSPTRTAFLCFVFVVGNQWNAVWESARERERGMTEGMRVCGKVEKVRVLLKNVWSGRKLLLLICWFSSLRFV